MPFRRDDRNPDTVQRGEITIARFEENIDSERKLNTLLLFNLYKSRLIVRVFYKDSERVN